MECVEQLTQNEAQHDAMNMCRLDLVTVGKLLVSNLYSSQHSARYLE